MSLGGPMLFPWTKNNGKIAGRRACRNGLDELLVLRNHEDRSRRPNRTASLSLWRNFFTSREFSMWLEADLSLHWKSFQQNPVFVIRNIRFRRRRIVIPQHLLNFGPYFIFCSLFCRFSFVKLVRMKYSFYKVWFCELILLIRFCFTVNYQLH